MLQPLCASQAIYATFITCSHSFVLFIRIGEIGSVGCEQCCPLITEPDLHSRIQRVNELFLFYCTLAGVALQVMCSTSYLDFRIIAFGLFLGVAR